MAKLHLPCLRGRLGDWTYFSTIMKIKDVVNNHRIITVSESEELYTENINKVLQRDISSKRIKDISNYLIDTDEHFFSSIIVAIHQGNPKWSDVDIKEQFTLDGKKLDSESINFIGNKIGVLTLSGGEEIFALDGQHRLVGLRDAITKNKELGEEEISLVYVIHNQDNVERTRRLFTVLNRYAQKPKQAELIILEEDDVAAINTRELVTKHTQLKKEKSITNSKSSQIPNTDLESLTTMVTVYRINKILYGKNTSYYTKRPPKKEIEKYYKISKDFWDFLFDVFPELEQFLEKKKDIKVLGSKFNRNIDTGGSLLLRPAGQQIIAKVFKKYKEEGRLGFLKKNLNKIDFNLSGDYFNYLFWNNGKMVPKELTLKYKLILYLLGETQHKDFVNKGFKKIYTDIKKDYIAFNPIVKKSNQ